jgi:cytochrome b involved in lipid metabolism
MPLQPSITPDDPLAGAPVISVEKLREHKSRKSCWISVDGLVYDVTDWLTKHPGGEIVILNAAGLDVSDLFNAYHPPSIRRMLKPYLIGRLEDQRVDKITLNFRELAASIESSDLMRVRPSFYIGMVSWYTALLVASISCVLFGKDTIWVSTVMGGILMAI